MAAAFAFTACRVAASHTPSQRLVAVQAEEIRRGINSDAYYATLQSNAERITADVLQFLQEAKAEGKSVAGYGAAAKGNTLLKLCWGDAGPFTLRLRRGGS